MKKSLIALAVLASSGAAMAQSNVTLYGIIDVSVGSLKEMNKASVSRVEDGGNQGLKTSRWGMKGSEDLGGGMKASFQLENRFDADAGTSQSPFFKGASTVSLSGGFGEVKLGRGTTVFDDIRALSYTSNVFDSTFSPADNGVFKSGKDYNKRWDNKVTYLTPDLGGFYAGVDYSLDEDSTVKKDKNALKLGYKAGPLNVALATQDEKTLSKYTMVAGSYDFGVASVSAGYNDRKGYNATEPGKDKEFTIGVNVPMGAFAVSAGYANSNTKVNGATTLKTNGYALGATYALSKRTKLYAGYRAIDTKNGANVKTADSKLYAVGIRHDF